MSLTSREVAVAIIPKVTGGLSMAGSAWIIGRVLSNPAKRHKTYHRLVACMSGFDFISSFCYFLSTWPIPPGENKGWNSPAHYAAVGNDATCSAQGFGIQLGITTVFLNVMLSTHYLLVIRYNKNERDIKRYEPLMLGVAVLIGLGLSVPGLALRMYNNSNLWCWISPNWDLCEEEGLSRDGCVSRTYGYRWGFYYGPLWACIALIVIVQCVLVRTVMRMEARTNRWRHRGTEESKAVRYRQSRQVAIQSGLYVAVFIITWLPYTAIAMTGRYFNPHTTEGFIVLLFVVICQPSQGWLNVFVYHRQPLTRARSKLSSRFTRMRVARSVGEVEEGTNTKENDNGGKVERAPEMESSTPSGGGGGTPSSDTNGSGNSNNFDDNNEARRSESDLQDLEDVYD